MTAERLRGAGIAPCTAVLCVAVVAHLLSWILPVIGDYVGWQAFRVALTSVWPYADFGSESELWYDRALSVTSSLTNVLFALALLAVATARRRLIRASEWGLVAAALLNLYWFVMMGDDRVELRIGYYLWVGSFLLLAAAAHMRVRAISA